jgi:Uma2 family endonuclease
VLVTRRADLGDERLERAPFLVVEIHSPRLADLTLKRAAYEAAGVPAYRLVDPAEPSLTVLRLEGHYVEEAKVTGDERYDASWPFPVSIVPSALLGGRT